MGTFVMNIAVCITTTPNRKDLFDESFFCLRENSPDNVDFIVYNDESYEGIAKSKNKCLSMCDGYDFAFLLDDDVYAIDKNWIYTYINSGLEHAMYIFDRQLIAVTSQYNAYDLPRGCMLFLTRKAINIAGGLDESFEKWGYEHAEYSRRIFNMGLTPSPFIDIPTSRGLFYSYDENYACESSVSNSDRRNCIPINAALYESKLNSKEFKSYK